jgi:hypothetical protein
MAKKTTFIDIELQWAESQLKTWRAYVDANPIDKLRDRIEYKPTARGGVMPMVIASIEQQGKFIQETMKNYLALLKEVDAMRTAEVAKIEARGKGVVTGQAAAWVNEKNGSV